MKPSDGALEARVCAPLADKLKLFVDRDNAIPVSAPLNSTLDLKEEVGVAARARIWWNPGPDCVCAAEMRGNCDKAVVEEAPSPAPAQQPRCGLVSNKIGRKDIVIRRHRRNLASAGPIDNSPDPHAARGILLATTASTTWSQADRGSGELPRGQDRRAHER